MITDPLLAGGTAAVILKGINILEQLVQRKRNGGKSNGFAQGDHDMLTVAAVRLEDVKFRLDRLHADLEEMKDLLRDKA